MKTTKLFSIFAITGLACSMLLSSCDTNSDVKPQEDILPQSFSVDIPSSISSQASATGGRSDGRAQTDTLKGNAIYLNLSTFIAVGEEASKLVEGIIDGIRKYRIEKIRTLTYVSGDDNRTKNLVVLTTADFEGATWDYELTITDADSEGAADGGKALQIFWNKSSLIKGIAIIKPYNCDRVKNASAPDAIFRIDYTEGGSLGYDKQMEVSIAGLPVSNPLNDRFVPNTLRMFAGKKGDVVDVYGNSNHPNAKFFTDNVGFDWAFVASSNDAKNIAVAEIGLPPSTLDSHDRSVLLKDYSIKNVFTTEINAAWPGLDPNTLAVYLTNTAAPGYFNAKAGFVAAGVAPGTDWDTLTPRLAGLTPYNPKETSNLVLSFK